MLDTTLLSRELPQLLRNDSWFRNYSGHHQTFEVIANIYKHILIITISNQTNQVESSSKATLPGLKILGSIVTTSVKCAEILIDIEEIIELIKIFLFNDNSEIRKESCWIIRNLAVHEKNLIKLYKLGFYTLLNFLITNDEDLEVYFILMSKRW